MTKTVWIFAFVLAFILSLAATLPLRFVLPDEGFAARGVSGTVWAGEISRVEFKGVQINDLRIGLGGWGKVQFTSPSPLSGILHPFSSGLQIEKLSGKVSRHQLREYLDQAKVQDVRLHFGTGGCLNAGGLIRLQLDKQIGDLPMGQVLTGTPRCRGKDLFLMLASQSREETLAVTVRADKSYVVTFGLGSKYVEHRATLIILGFEQTAQGFQSKIAGRI
jgi:general secretion pathway protein N